MNSDKLPQVMSLESASVGWLKTTKLKMKIIWAHQTSVARSSSLLEGSGFRLA